MILFDPFIGLDEMMLDLLALLEGFDTEANGRSSGRDIWAGFDCGATVRGVFGSSFRTSSSTLRFGRVLTRGRVDLGTAVDGVEGCPVIWARRSPIGILKIAG